MVQCKTIELDQNDGHEKDCANWKDGRGEAFLSVQIWETASGSDGSKSADYDIYIRTPTLCLIESIFNDSNSDNNWNYTIVFGPQDSKCHPNWQYSSRQFLCDKNVGVDDEFLRWT